MRILVLGGTAFVGRAIVEDALRSGPRDTEELDKDTCGPLKVACEDDVVARYGARAAAMPATPLAVTVADVLAWDRERGEPPLGGSPPSRSRY